MPHNKPWYKREGKDVLMACMGMPDSDYKWAYSAIIDLLNDYDRPIPDDPKFLCQFTGLTKQKWRKVREYLIDDGKLIVMGDYLTNPRFEREMKERRQEHEQRKRAGRKGGIAKAENAENQQEMDLVDKTATSVENGVDKEKPTKKLAENLKKTSVVFPKFSQSSEATFVENKGKNSSVARAREESKSLRDTIDDSSITISPRARAREGSDRQHSIDSFEGLVERCIDAAGMSLRTKRSPKLKDQQRDIVASWRAMGVDIVQHAIPLIERVTEKFDEPTGSLARFSAMIETDHLKRKQKEG